MSDRRGISEQLRERRRETGLSLAKLALRSDTSAATLSRYESGWTRFELSTLRKLATALGCELRVDLVPRPRRTMRPSGSEVVERIKRLFWDVPLAVEHLTSNTLWVVERVLELGTLEDLESLVALLGREAFLEHVSRARFSSERTRVFWRQILAREGVECTKRRSPGAVETRWRGSPS